MNHMFSINTLNESLKCFPEFSLKAMNCQETLLIFKVFPDFPNFPNFSLVYEPYV